MVSAIAIFGLCYSITLPRNEDKRQRSARVSRLLRMLRAHHLIQKVPHTHRYVLTSRGREIVSAVVASQQITLEQLNKLAA